MAMGDNIETIWRDVVCALRFLTRLPLRHCAEAASSAHGDISLAQAAWAFPVAGLAVGSLTGGTYYLAFMLGLGAPTAAILAVASGVMISGALHEDGLADFLDGMGARQTETSHRLAIMRDPRTGVFGALALLFSVALRVVALAQIARPDAVVSLLIAAHVLSRGLLPWAMRRLPPARSDGLAVDAGAPTGVGVVVALLASGAISAVALGMADAVIVLAAATAAAAGIGVWAMSRLGGQTGDVLGAIQQGAEISVLLTGIALLTMPS